MNTKPKFAQRFYGKNSAKVINIMMIIMAFSGIMMLIDTSFDAVEPLAQIKHPLFSAVTLLVSVPLLSIAFALGSNIDRRCTEDYTFQLMANAALVAVITMMFFNLFSNLEFLGELTGLRQMQREDMTGVTLLSWASAYFYFQRKGLKG